MEPNAARRTARDFTAMLVLAVLLASCGGDSTDPGPVVATVEVSPPTADRRVGETVQLSATVKDASGTILSGQAVTWSSSAANVASVSSSGLVTANAIGSAIITAAAGSKSGVATINVVQLVATVDVSPPTADRQVGQTIQLSATVRDGSGNIVTGQSVAWSSSASTVASVSSSGLVTANALGSAIITAAVGSKSGVATINVVPPPIASISVAPPNDTLLVGETLQLTATLRDANNAIVTRPVTWTSSSPTTATVSNSGLVTAVADGSVTITATADGRSASSNITVWGPCRTILAPTITVGQTINASLAATDCKLDDNSYADGYSITVATATNVQIDMTASFDTYLYLLELLPGGGLVERASNDDVDVNNTNSRIVFTLQPNLQYFILANSFDPNVFGNYQLKVTATAFVAGNAVEGKRGKAPISSLIKALKPAR